MRCLAACGGLFLPAALALLAPAWGAPSLAGTWFGQGQPGDRQSMYLDRLTADGQIHSRFRDCPKGQPPIDSTGMARCANWWGDTNRRRGRPTENGSLLLPTGTSPS